MRHPGHAIRNTCNIATDAHQHPTYNTKNARESYQPLTAIYKQQVSVASNTTTNMRRPVVVGTRSPPSLIALVNQPRVNLPSVNEGSNKRGNKTWSCIECRKTFTSSSGLWKHALTHTGERPYSCSYCGKQFNRQENMLRHQRAHTGVKPFKCLVCDKAFGIKSSTRATGRTRVTYVDICTDSRTANTSRTLVLFVVVPSAWRTKCVMQFC